jgi:uncharacterized tellurite resistance protein B-like protein
MKTQLFKEFLFESAVIAMGCDGDIATSEIEELKKIVTNEIYFMGYSIEEPLKVHLANIKANGKNAINNYLKSIESLNLSDNQEVLLIEVLLRIIEADSDIQISEVKFLQMAKAKLKLDEQTLIMKFPNHIDLLLDVQNYGLDKEFTEDLSFE